MAHLRIFDPDVHVSHITPQQLVFPLHAQILLDHLPKEELAKLPAIVAAGHTLPYALFSDWKQVGSALYACVHNTDKLIWLPWVFLSPNINLSPN